MRYRQRDERASTHPALWWISLGLVAAGIALRLWQYLGRSALWTDEATLANNIVSRSIGRLLMEPLGHNQAAPPGFLAIEKAAVMIFGANELALRAFPLLCSIVALVLLCRIAARLLAPAVVPIAIAPFALAPPLVFFATEAKQYSSDVAIALALLLVALEIGARPPSARRATAAAFAGVFAVWLSQPAVLVVCGLGAALLLTAWMDGARDRTRPLTAIVGAWAASAIAATVVSLHRLDANTHGVMYTFWSDGFWTPSPLHPSSLVWPFMRTASLLNNQLAVPGSAGVFGALIVIVGVVELWRRDRNAALLLVAPLAVALGAAAAHLYPFADRLALFVLPSLVLLVAAGVEGIAAAAPSSAYGSIVIAAALLTILALDARGLRAAPPVYRREEITPSLAYLRHNATAADRLYVYYGAVPAFQFYASQRAIPGEHTLGSCHRGDPRAYLRELDAGRGRTRLWVLFAHELPRLRERVNLVRYLSTIGTMRDSLVTNGRDVNGSETTVHLYLFDLSDSTRSNAVNAENFPIPVQPPVEARLQCVQWNE
jgi:hypothetical protein